MRDRYVVAAHHLPAAAEAAGRVRAAGSEARQRIVHALHKLDVWVETEGFRGFDPHDALKSPLLRRLSFNRRLPGIVFVQLLKRSPVNVRPLLGIRKSYNPKGMGLCLASYVRKHALYGRPEHLTIVDDIAGWLQGHTSAGYHGACWGYDFPWPNRGFYAPAGTPTVVNTAFIGAAFLDLYHHLGRRTCVDVARSACEFILRDLNRLPGPRGFCFSYTPIDRRQVHNASLLGAELLTRVWSVTGESQLIEAARQAVEFTIQHQKPDGSWAYGVGPRERWVDGFHTGYVIDSLTTYMRHTGDTRFRQAIEDGLTFYFRTLLLPDGTPRYYRDKTYPIDVHCASQAILTALGHAEEGGAAAADLATRVALWTIEHMQSDCGAFCYQLRPLYTIRIPYMRWSAAWMQRALTEMTYRWASGGRPLDGGGRVPSAVPSAAGGHDASGS
jgi:hypothetical protein